MSAAMATPTPSPEFLAEYNGYNIVIAAVVFLVAVTILVLLRFLSRGLAGVALGLDDLLLIPAVLCNYTELILMLLFVTVGGAGHHLAELVQHPQQLTVYGEITFALVVTYLFGVTLPKLAILVLYLRVFTLRSYRIACYIIAAVLTSTFLANFIALMNVCHPIAYLWDPTIPGGWCFNQVLFYRWSTFPNIVTDVAMLVLPMPIIWGLHLPLKDRIGLLATFATASVGLITSCLRFAAFVQSNGAGGDVTWTAGTLSVYSIVEPSCYLIAACLPTYRQLFAPKSRDRLCGWIPCYTPSQSCGSSANLTTPSPYSKHTVRSATRRDYQGYELRGFSHHQYNGSEAGLTKNEDHPV